MSWLDELSELERRAKDRLAELEPQVANIEPLIAEYNDVKALLERLGRERDAAASTAAPAADTRRPAPKRVARKRAAAKPAAGATKPSRRGGSRQGRNAARPGERERQLLELVTARPGIKVSEIAGELGVDPTGLYGIVRRLEGKGRLTKDGPGLRLGSATGERSHPLPARPDGLTTRRYRCALTLSCSVRPSDARSPSPGGSANRSRALTIGVRP